MKTPDLAGTTRHLELEVLDYLEEWYPETPDDFEIDWRRVEIKVTGRLKTSMGKARGLSDKEELKISKHIFENFDMERVEKTIRHEAVHVWQYQNGYSGHGRSFEVWMGEFDIDKEAESRAADPNYVVSCQACGVEYRRVKKSKVVKEPERYNCGECGGDLERTL